MFYLSQSPVTLSEDQDHSSWYQNVESSNVYITPSLKETGLEVSKHKPIINIFSPKSQKLSSRPLISPPPLPSLSLNRPTHNGSIPNFIQNNRILQEKQCSRFCSHITVTLNEGQGHSHGYQTIQFSDV